MATGSKARYTAKQIREVRDIEEGYVKHGFPRTIASKIAWATVKVTSGDKKTESKPGKKIKKAAKKPTSKKITTKTSRVTKRKTTAKKTPRPAAKKIVRRKMSARRKKK